MAKRPGVVRPSLFWFVLLDGGIVVLTRLVVSKKAHERGSEISSGKLPSQPALRNLLIATAVIHSGEALAAGRMARRRGLTPRGWRLQTLIVGFPSLRKLRQVPVP